MPKAPKAKELRFVQFPVGLIRVGTTKPSQEQIGQSHKSPIRFADLWNELHRYAIDHKYAWHPGTVATWFAAWLSRVPNFGCECRSNFARYVAHSDVTGQLPRGAWRSYRCDHPAVLRGVVQWNH